MKQILNLLVVFEDMDWEVSRVVILTALPKGFESETAVQELDDEDDETSLELLLVVEVSRISSFTPSFLFILVRYCVVQKNILIVN